MHQAQSSLPVWRRFGSSANHRAPREVSDQTARMHRLIWLLAEPTGNLSQLMILWYLSHRRPAKAQASLRIRAVSPELLLFEHMNYGNGRRVRPKNQTSSLIGWLCVCIWKMSLWRTGSTIISWHGSFVGFAILQLKRISPSLYRNLPRLPQQNSTLEKIKDFWRYSHKSLFNKLSFIFSLNSFSWLPMQC